MTVNDDQIRDLRARAIACARWGVADICSRALGAYDDTTWNRHWPRLSINEARDACAQLIAKLELA